MSDTTTTTRMDRFKALCVEYLGAVPDENGPYHTTAEEDAAEYLHDAESNPLGRYCLVTVGGELGYLYPVANSIAEIAPLLATKVGDLTFGEGPRCVEDLDTGATYWPRWSTLQWGFADGEAV